MANRVILGQLPDGDMGLRVSRPGSNALNDNLPGKQVAFDTRWIGACRLVKSGTVTVGNDGGTATVMFGVTLPTPPAVIAIGFSIGTSQDYYRPFGNDASGRRVVNDPDASGVNAGLRPDTNPAIDIRTDRVIFRNDGNTDVRVHYVIMRL